MIAEKTNTDRNTEGASLATEKPLIRTASHSLRTVFAIVLILSGVFIGALICKPDFLSRGTIAAFAVVLMAVGVFTAALICKPHFLPLSFRQSRYSIGIFTGRSPFELRNLPETRNPVLTADDVTDIKAGFVADPFMLRENGRWFMFFEVLNMATDQGDIGLAVSQDGVHWKYKQIVLNEPFHLSYPYVFKWKEDYFMIPETVAMYGIRLYKAVEFPLKWTFVKILVKGNYFDSSIVRYSDRWWIFTSDRNDMLHLFFAEDLLGTWTEHPRSPIVFRNAKIARPAGRLLVIHDRAYRFAQECYRTYGYQVRAFEIVKMTTIEYEEREVDTSPVLKPSGKGWNGEKMHHIDAHQLSSDQWIACVDGRGQTYGLKLR